MPDLIKRTGLRLALLACAALLVGGCASLTSALGINAPGVPGATPGAGLDQVGCSWGQGTPVATPVALHPIGQAVAVGSLTVTVNGAFCVPAIGQDLPRNVQFVIVQFTIDNHGSTSQNISTTFQTYLVDGSGRNYSPDVTASADAGAPIDGPIEPGGRQAGRVGFAVPITVTGLTFVFSTHPFASGGDAHIAIH